MTRSLSLCFLLAASGCGSSGLICKVKKDGALERCLDATKAKAQQQEITLFETACRAAGHELTSEACPTANVVGACRTASGNEGGVSVATFYDSAAFKTLADVKQQCTDGEVLDASGNVVHTNNGVCSAPVGSIKVVTFRNDSDAGATVYLRDTACAETEKGTLAAGGIQGFPTYEGDSWTARAGTSDANGAILLEYVTPASSAGLVSIP